LDAVEDVPNAVELVPDASVWPAVELPPTATAPVAEAVGLWPATVPADEPIAIDAEEDATPPPAEYCAWALFTPILARITAAQTACATARLLGLPLAESISDAATQAPKDSFQIVRYEWFISNASLILRGKRYAAINRANFLIQTFFEGYINSTIQIDKHRQITLNISD
jgi:hypothetical protein